METVSMALYDDNGKYYMQIIHPDGNEFIIPITQHAAHVINGCNGQAIYDDREFMEFEITQ